MMVVSVIQMGPNLNMQVETESNK